MLNKLTKYSDKNYKSLSVIINRKGIPREVEMTATVPTIHTEKNTLDFSMLI